MPSPRTGRAPRSCAPARLLAGAAAPVLVLLGFAATGCVTQAEPLYPREPLPLPEDVAARYELPEPVREEVLVPIGGEDGLRFFRGRLRCGEEQATFQLIRPAARAGSPRSFVLCLPILAGGEDLMWIVAQGLARSGHVVAWTERAGRPLQQGDDGQDLEELLRRTVVQNRMLLAWARRQPDVDAARIGCLGISMGGIVGAVVAALEPQLAGSALVMAGGGMAELIAASTEGRIERWRRWRARDDGVGRSLLVEELDQALVSDPARLGAYVPTEKVYMVATLLDSVVPPRHQDLLWESLGRPRRLLVPLGHYTAALQLGTILASVDRFLQERFDANARLVAQQQRAGRGDDEALVGTR